MGAAVSGSLWDCGPDEVGQAEQPPVAPWIAKLIATHMESHSGRLAKITGCSADGSNCPLWWQRREAAWRARAGHQEHLRLCTHARLFGDFLPKSHAPLNRKPRSAAAPVGAFAPVDHWEPSYACSADERVPSHLGDGPKWVCGAEALPKPCELLSLGSNFDDSFERAMHSRAGCRAYVVDPTLGISGTVSNLVRTETVPNFTARLAAYGATLNSSIGVGEPTTGGAMIRHDADKSVVRFHVVTLRQLLVDRFGQPPWRLDAFKIDIEGNEASVLREAFEMCAAGELRVAQLNVELHASTKWYPHSFRTFHELYTTLDGALSCGLLMHHKERNLWGCHQAQCTELSWVSIDHARQAALATTEGAGRRLLANGAGGHHHSTTERETQRAEKQRRWVTQALSVGRRPEQLASIGFLFMSCCWGLPNFRAWSAFFADAPSPRQYSILAMVCDLAKLDNLTVASIQALDVHVIRCGNGGQWSDGAQHWGFGKYSTLLAVHFLLKKALLYLPESTQKFCILDETHLPIWNFRMTYESILRQSSSALYMNGTLIRSLRNISYDAMWSADSQKDTVLRNLLRKRVFEGNVLHRRQVAQLTRDDDGLAKQLNHRLKTLCEGISPCHARDHYIIAMLRRRSDSRPVELEVPDAVAVLTRALPSQLTTKSKTFKSRVDTVLFKLRKMSCNHQEHWMHCLNSTRWSGPLFANMKATGIARGSAASLRGLCTLLAHDHAQQQFRNGVAYSNAVCDPRLNTAVGEAWPKRPPLHGDVVTSVQALADSPEVIAYAQLSHASQSSAASATVQYPPVRLLFAFAFWLPKWEAAVDSIKRWGSHGEPCTGVYAPWTTLLMAPGFTSATSPAEFEEVRNNVDAALPRAVSRCFREQLWSLDANFSGIEAEYPLSASAQFFRLMNSSLARGFDLLWVMEQDVTSLRPRWLDALYSEALTPSAFWIKGSMHRGMPAFEDSLNASLSMLNNLFWFEKNKDWLPHINGAALYRLNDPLFQRFIHASEALVRSTSGLSTDAPSAATASAALGTLGGSCPWDICLSLALNDAMGLTKYGEGVGTARGSFATRQLLSTKVLYTDFVWNVGAQIGSPMVLDAARANGVYLLHGQAKRSMRNERKVVARTYQQRVGLMVNADRLSNESCTSPKRGNKQDVPSWDKIRDQKMPLYRRPVRVRVRHRDAEQVVVTRLRSPDSDGIVAAAADAVIEETGCSVLARRMVTDTNLNIEYRHLLPNGTTELRPHPLPGRLVNRSRFSRDDRQQMSSALEFIVTLSMK